MNDDGHPVSTASLIGHPAPSLSIDFGIDAHLYEDWPAIVAVARRRWPRSPLIAVGHSLGGVLSVMHAGRCPHDFAAVASLCSVDPHFRRWPGRQRAGILAFYHAFAAIARAVGYLPGQHLRWGGPVARGVMLDWTSWGITGRHRGTAGQNLGALLAGAACPVLVASFTDDRMAPRATVDAFAARLSAAPLTRWHLSPEDLGLDHIGHFGHLRDGDALWDRLLAWADDVLR